MTQRYKHLSASLCFAIHILMWCSCHNPDEVIIPEDHKSALLEQINKLRATGCTCGNQWMVAVKALTWNNNLENAALSHASDMYLNDYFSHLSRDGSSPIQRAQNAGYSGDYVGEVIARRYHSTKDVVEAWRESEDHCRALMDSLYNEMGGARKEDYWVVDLGKSR